MMNPQQKRAAKMLMAKIRREDPKFYHFIQSRSGTNLGQAASNMTTGLTAEVQQESWFDKIANAATSFYQIKQQKDIMDMQLKRAEQGLPPLDTASLAPPPMRIEVTAPEFAPTFMDAKKIALPVIGAAIAWLLFRRK